MTVNSVTEQLKTKRQRGVILTPKGFQRFQAAIQELEASQVNGSHLTLEKLSERINVSTKTLSRLSSLNLGVDRKTLKLCFSALNLELYASDYALLNQQTEIAQQAEVEGSSSSTFASSENETGFTYSNTAELFGQKQQPLSALNLSYPDGPLALDSPFYIERPPIEALAYQEITQPGCIISIRAPKGMGKSSLVLRLLGFAKVQKYRVAALDCRQLDSSCLTDLNKF